ncbi:HTH-type transcriptional repressor Bm3R1 [Sinobacterium norvegicum]|uniref:HTH-type transcriptional repressor Bm3R1 n=1 Tax=Sinobacterium norvegicum TaxID=1641715 RepID=A0ABM9AB84_9GAMM|nr:TetR/AcrR family transcriptional regulator [Sinobacterium norvegicum]CAH0990448.1 HTH-type transcriptional repressor Bm3R1 [Sinobacterium norvegicum]
MNVDKRQKILNTALTLFVEQGYHATSTASLAKKAGVANGTVFHHFGSKKQLINELYLSIKTELADNILPKEEPELLIDQAKLLWNNAINWAIVNPKKHLFFDTFTHTKVIDATVRQEAMNNILGFICQMIQKGQQQKIIADFPIELMLENCYGQYINAASYFIEHPEFCQSEHHRDASFKLFWNAMRL